MDKYPMTPAGLKKIEAELRKLREVDRPANIRAIEEAREHGDLSENAEYKYAKEQQALIAGRLEHLEDRISRSEVIDPKTLSGNRVVFGALVSIEDLDSGEERTLRIVGEDEADLDAGTISITSPIARGLIGKEVDDEAKIMTPSGPRTFEIVDLEF